MLGDLSESTKRRLGANLHRLKTSTGGEGGIRTHVRVSPKHAFQACAFNHSATSPGNGCPFEFNTGNSALRGTPERSNPLAQSPLKSFTFTPRRFILAR